MPSNAMQASQDLIQLAAKFKQITDVAEVLERIGSLEQATRDAEEKKNLAYQASDDADKAVLAKLEDVKEAQKLLDAKKAEAVSVIDEAKKEAGRIVDQAILKANELQARAEARKQEIAKSAQEIHDQMEAMKKEIEAKSKEHAFISEQLKEAKRKIAAFGAE